MMRIGKEAFLLRLHFTADDLKKVRLLRNPDPVWEIVCSICRLKTGEGQVAFGAWRDSTRSRLQQDARLRAALSPLRGLIPSVGYIPDFLTPSASADLSAALEAVRGTPSRVVTRQLIRLERVQREAGRPGTAPRPADTDPGTVAAALRTYFDTVLRPHWPRMRALVGADADGRTQSLLDGGVEELLNGLAPFARWRDPVLEVDYPVDREVALDGRGLVLVPSFFCWRRPTAPADPTLAPVLVYPVAKESGEAARAWGAGAVRLLGRTRAAVLSAVARGDGRTSSDVAHAVGIAHSSTSYQIEVLRDGGLVSSRRSGKHVVHSVTPLGLRILAAG
ncbi:ArsR/SmtB family transcription factor [Streptomyces beihaiensis]|uniref:Helix-turn-helix domain-containing protein n=1 Tax=Streptomyces beihaiensis TaxID=2984495 RepID=A0ABT3TMJ2_9ACTN|nr:helix-turn-helix domain-containing protein [Streptomyces beihaiensis]MCX3058267.1 helix-turn-helix domain-containing protein [Streptomyces beihaiensis]